MDIWGFLPPPPPKKKTKNCQKCQLYPLPDVGEIRRVYAGIRSMEVVNIWCDSVGKLGIYRPKPRWGISFKIFGYPGSETTGPIEKIRGCKNGTVITYLHAEFGRDPPLHGGARKKSWEFLFFSVCHALDLELE